MTVIGVALFGLASFALAGAAFALMWKNLSDINKPIKVYVNDQDINHPNPLSSSNHPEVAEIETDENGASPLVLSRGSEEGEQKVSDKPSRRRGPLRRRRNGDAGDAQTADMKPAESKSANEPEAATETSTEIEPENVQALDLNKAAGNEAEAQVEVAVDAGTSDAAGDVSAVAND